MNMGKKLSNPSSNQLNAHKIKGNAFTRDFLVYGPLTINYLIGVIGLKLENVVIK